MLYRPILRYKFMLKMPPVSRLILLRIMNLSNGMSRRYIFTDTIACTTQTNFFLIMKVYFRPWTGHYYLPSDLLTNIHHFCCKDIYVGWCIVGANIVCDVR